MRAKWAIVAACLVAVVAIAYAAGKTSAPEVIRARRFEAVDPEGRVRGLMGMGSDGGSPVLALIDEKGKQRALLSLDPDGNPNLGLYDEKGTMRAVLSLAADGSPGLLLRDEKGPRASLALTSPLRFSRRAGEPLAQGSPALELLDERARPIAVLP